MTAKLAPTYRAMLETVPDEWGPAPALPVYPSRDVKAVQALVGRGLIEMNGPDWRRTDAGRAVLGVMYQPAPDFDAQPITEAERRVAAVVHQVMANLEAAGYVSSAQMVAAPVDHVKLAVWVAVNATLTPRDALIGRLLDKAPGARRDARAHLKGSAS